MIKNIDFVSTSEITLYERIDTDDSEAMILTVYFLNYSGSSVNLTIYLKEVGNATADDDNAILKDEPIAAGKTYELNASEKIMLKGHTAAASRNKLSAKVDTADAMTATVSYTDL